jgi:hypothetical protein
MSPFLDQRSPRSVKLFLLLFAFPSSGFTLDVLIFILPGRVIKFSAWDMKNVLLEEKKIKIRNREYLVEQKTNYAACVKNAVHFLTV